MSLELRHLRYFMAVAEELNFGRAARRLHMTQPPLSQQIMQLEEQIGAPLFVRGRPLQLTDAGNELLIQAKRLLGHADSVVQSVKQAARGERGKLTLAFIAGALPHLFPAIIKLYRSRFPQVDLDLKELVTPLQHEALRTGEIDVGLMRPLGLESDFETRMVLRERMIVALPAGHRHASQAVIGLNDLIGEPVVAFDAKEAGYFDLITRRIFGQVQSEPRVVQTARQLYTVLATVAAGVGIALVAASAKDLAFPGVIFREIEQPEANFSELILAWRKEATQPVLSNFIDTALEVAALTPQTIL
ncbi:LysR substrate-binding domain-containing protein [Parapusillimonas granuli]|uniref:LysR family transcriptional regulator n=1 Tax=Parapusillimonas granuli TaxID=380911 RepID=A0A853G193_9BURK|nr:LysR substrate-binding domain-containing protein [Parapusillimonas granuli]MBB5215681.1 DNA-binding transcriptional LysR family regulator [Parapusillimonas granuli]MEB2401930.1 LysR substrate-binding domain-containing protein [Alcaligenaceae bacterium]NYT49652.1 LysR family transcriptional regulator [Parapusillimonas granuli]